MEKIQSINELEKYIRENKAAFLYVSSNNCSVCHALMPKIEELLERYPKIIKKRIIIDEVQEVAGYLSVFTIPVVILFIEGKEIFRSARFISINEVEGFIDRYYDFIQ